MVNIKEAIIDTAAGIGEEADCMLVIIKKGEIVHSGIIGIDKMAIGPDAVALAMAIRHMLDGGLEAASKIADVMQESGVSRCIEVGTIAGPTQDRGKNMRELTKTAEERIQEIKAKSEDRNEAAKDAVRGFFHKILNDIIDEAIGGDDDADDD